MTTDPATSNDGVRPPWLRQDFYPFESHYAQVNGLAL